MRNVEVELDCGKTLSHFLSTKVGVDTRCMRSAKEIKTHAIISYYSNSMVVN